jgi:hypothetical protein
MVHRRTQEELTDNTPTDNPGYLLADVWQPRRIAGQMRPDTPTTHKEIYTMNTLNSKSVYHQPANVPANLHIWQDENHGISALLNAAQDMLCGKIVRFALCNREGTLPPTVAEIVTLGMATIEGRHTPRYCGENNDPDGAGSHSLIASWYNYCNDPAAIAVAMSQAFLCNHEHYFRLA